MKKKLLAGILALALCSTNMPPQTIFAGEFTSGNPDVVSEEETLEIFTNEEQEAVGETDEELSVFSSEEIPEFNDTPDEAMAAAENAQNEVIDLTDNTKVSGGVYTITSAGDYKFTCSNSQETANRIVVDGTHISEKDNIKIYLDNVNINTSTGSALQIQSSVQAQVYIYLEGINKLNSGWNAALQKDNAAKLTIDNSPNTTGELIAISSYGAGIGGDHFKSSSDITIRGGSVTATSTFGAGIGGGQGNTGSNIAIRGGSVTATSDFGAGIGGGSNGGSGSNITISGGFVTATSSIGAGIGGGFGNTGSNITISGGSVTATSTRGAGIGGGSNGGTCSNIAISGGSVTATSTYGVGFGCPPHKNLNSTGNNPEVYLCTVSNPQKRNISIDGVDWITYNHVTNNSVDNNLYAWLTGADHTITVGNDKRTYSFNQTNNQFIRIKTDPTAAQFDYTQLNFTYTKDTPVDISNYIE